MATAVCLVCHLRGWRLLTEGVGVRDFVRPGPGPWGDLEAQRLSEGGGRDAPRPPIAFFSTTPPTPGCP
jgi:hypothetical protein